MLLTNRYIPPINYKFPGRPDPVNGHLRYFQHQWLSKHQWLVYSAVENGGFCLPCMLFGQGRGGSHDDLGVLVSRPLTNFRRALEHLKNHDSKDTHKAAVTKADDFLKVMQGQQEPVNQQIDRALADRVTANRRKLIPIIKTILLCGHQNIPLRGHNDSATQAEVDPSANHGNFWALLDFRIDAGDSDLADHLATAPRNSRYTSADIQNQLVTVIGDLIRGKILNKVRETKYFTVIADEVTDSANMEQLSLVLRYVDPDSSALCEDFMEFLHCDSGVTGEALSNKILNKLQEYDLDLNLLRGQGYDGASNMSNRCKKGVASRITSQYPLALYLHCFSHCLNLVIVKSAEISSIRNMMGICKKVHDFFDVHPKHQLKLEEAIGETQPEHRITKIKDLSRTRWVQRLDALHTMCILHPSIVTCMETIKEEGSRLWSSTALADACSLLLAVTNADFLSALVIAQQTLGYLRGITISLQAESKDIVQAVSEVDEVIEALQSARDNVDELHTGWFNEVEQMCREVGVEPQMPRRCGRQQHRANIPAENPSDFFKRVITIPLLDHLLQEMKTRFATHQMIVLNGLCLVPAVLVQLPLADLKEKLNSLVELYKTDLPSPGSIFSEFHAWQVKWKKQLDMNGPTSLPKTPAEALKKASSLLFPNVRTILTILCVLPVTSCTCERSHSSLKTIKTRLRSTMGNARLTGLALMYIHRDVKISPEEIIDEFAKRHPRKMQLHNIMKKC